METVGLFQHNNETTRKCSRLSRLSLPVSNHYHFTCSGVCSENQRKTQTNLSKFSKSPSEETHVVDGKSCKEKEHHQYPAAGDPNALKDQMRMTSYNQQKKQYALRLVCQPNYVTHKLSEI